jgi:hypothetical protein
LPVLSPSRALTSSTSAVLFTGTHLFVEGTHRLALAGPASAGVLPRRSLPDTDDLRARGQCQPRIQRRATQSARWSSTMPVACINA